MRISDWSSDVCSSDLCGQLIAVRRAAYERAGGHAAIRSSLHDGLTLPRAFRRCGLRTDLFDATEIASCRMYEGARAVWAGLSKNATEGMSTPRSEEHTSELQSLMRISSAVFCFTKK